MRHEPIGSKKQKGVFLITRRYDSADAKRRILSVCVRLFIEKGYQESKMAEILKEADVTSSTFHNIFRTKDGVLMDLTEFMFESQFEMANEIAKRVQSPVLIYAVETAIQLTLAELNENIREVYVEAYSQPKIAEYIYGKMTQKLYHLFSAYLPEYNESNFYELEIGTAAVMRGYMSRPCDIYFTLERKLACFLRITMGAYSVPAEEQERALAFVAQIDVRKTANEVMRKLFSALEMKYDFTFSPAMKEQ